MVKKGGIGSHGDCSYRVPGSPCRSPRSSKSFDFGGLIMAGTALIEAIPSLSILTTEAST